MKKLLFLSFLLMASHQVSANVTTLYILFPSQPQQDVTVAACDTLVIMNQSSSMSYMVYNTTATGWPLGPPIAYGWDNPGYFYFTDLTAYNYLSVKHQGSNVLFHITVTPGPQSTISATICHGSSYSFNGVERTATGTYLQYISTAGPGCDSVLRLELTVTPPVSNTTTATICQGTSYSFQGNTHNSTGIYRDTLQTAAGCDSVLVLDLTVSTAIPYYHTGTICQGASYTFNGHTYTTAGSYSDTLPTATGCDSVVVLNLTVTPPYVLSPVEATICPQQTYVFNGNEYAASGTYYDTLQASNQCYYISQLNLVVQPIATNVTASICQGSSYSFMGNDYTEAGDYSVVLQTPGGCDSTVTLHLTYDPGGNVSIFQMDENTLSATSPVTFNFLWLDCDNNYAFVEATNGSFTATQSGSYAVMAIHNGCADTSECILLEEAGLEEIAAAAFFVYPVPADDQITVTTDEALNGMPFYLMDLSGKILLNGQIETSETLINIADLASGMYVLRIGGGMKKILKE
jgi:hypothetical protein